MNRRAARTLRVPLAIAAAVVAVAPTGSAHAAEGGPAPLQRAVPALTASTFADPPAAVRPKYRWWLPAAATDDAELRAELAQVKAVGGGGVEVSPFPVPGRENRANATLVDNGWFSPEWLRKTRVIADAAEDEGVVLDQTLGPQAQGFARVPLDDGLNNPHVMQQLVHGYASVAPGQTFDGPLPSNFSPALSTIDTTLCTPAAPGDDTLRTPPVGGISAGDALTVGTGSAIQRVTVTKVDEDRGACGTLAVAAEAGATVLKTGQGGFDVGDEITVGTGTDAQRTTVTAVGSTAVSTTFLAPATAGTSSVYINPGGLEAGDRIRLGTGAGEEVRTVASIGLGGYLLNVTEPFAKDHGPGAPITAEGAGITVSPALTAAHPAGAPVQGQGSGGMHVTPALTNAAVADTRVRATADAHMVGVVAAQCEATCASAPRMLVQSSVRDLTSSVEDGRVRFTAPAGDQPWVVLALYRSTDPGHAGYTGSSPDFDVDALSTDGARLVTDAWDRKVFTPEMQVVLDQITKQRGTGSLFIDSYEFSTNLKWTADMVAEWQRRNGTSLARLLPALTGARASALGTPAFDFAGTGSRIRETYRQTYSDLHVERFLEPLQRWAEGHRLTMRVQPYNGPIDSSRAASTLGIPEGEGLAFADAPGAYNVIAAGAHMSGQPVVSTECCAGADKDYNSTAAGNVGSILKAFAGGVNQVVWHGLPYRDAPRSTWPGYHAWSAAANAPDHQEAWGPRLPQWAHYRGVNDALSRMQLVLRQGRPRYDVAVYHRDLGSDDQYGGLVTPSIGPDSRLAKAGFNYEFLSPAFLEDPEKAVFRDGALFPEQSGYRAVVVDDETAMPLSALRKLYYLAKDDGLPVVLSGRLPSRVPGDGSADDATVASLAGKLAALGDDGAHRVVRVPDADAIPEALDELGVRPAVRPAEGQPAPANVRRSTADAELYYLLNTEKEAVERTVTLRGAGVPFRLDAATGEITPIAQYRSTADGVTLRVRLGADDAALIALAPDGFAGVRAPKSSATETTGDDVVPDAASPSGLAVRASKAGTVRTTLNDGTPVGTRIDAVGSPVRLDRWRLAVQSWRPGPATTATENVSDIAKVDLPGVDIDAGADGTLPAWRTLDGLADVSGVGTYTATVELGTAWTGGHRAYLRLGAATDTVAVRVNGHAVPIDQAERGRIDLGDRLRAGENTVEVRVASTLQNAVRVAPGNAAYVGRDRIDYGLLGPVELVPYGQAPVVRDAAQPAPPVDPTPPSVPGPPTTPTPPGAGPPKAKLRLTRVAVSPNRLRPGRSAKLRVTLDRRATVRVELSRRVTGRRSGTRCVTGARAPENGARCVTWIRVSRLAVTAPAGRSATTVVTAARSRRLRPGLYRMTATATTADAARPVTIVRSIRVLRP
jgi:hypothetical protein